MIDPLRKLAEGVPHGGHDSPDQSRGPCTVGARGGEARTQRRKYDSVWASQHEELCRDEVVAPYVCDLLVGPDLGVAPDRCHSPGAAGDAGLDAATHARRAERTADGGVMSVPA